MVAYDVSACGALSPPRPLETVSSRDTCLASQRSRPAGVRTPRASSSWAMAEAASQHEPNQEAATPNRLPSLPSARFLNAGVTTAS
jgi:hypothetical protein